MLNTRDIVDDVRHVLDNARTGTGPQPHFLTAYQILDRLPPAVQQQLIAERTLGGRGSGVRYAAPGLVSDAAESLIGIEIDYMDAVGVEVACCGQRLVPGNDVVGLYRLRR